MQGSMKLPEGEKMMMDVLLVSCCPENTALKTENRQRQKKQGENNVLIGESFYLKIDHEHSAPVV